MFCGMCGQEQSADMKFCKNCGASTDINKTESQTTTESVTDTKPGSWRIKRGEKKNDENAPTTKICRQCDEEVKINAKICKWCGTDFREDYLATLRPSGDLSSVLLDFFLFKDMISPALIKIIYFFGAIFGTAATIIYAWKAYSFWSLSYQVANNGVLWVLIIFGVIVGNLIWRLACETWILFWSIHETLVSINKKKS